MVNAGNRQGEEMKKKVFILCSMLFLCLMLVPAGCMGGANVDTLTGWNIQIVVPEGTTAVLEENDYYIYAGRAGEIPYVIIRTYRYGDETALIKDFTTYMAGQYADLKVTADATKKTVGDKECYEIDYAYTISDYDVRDRRIVMVADGTAYMFGSKEIDSLGRTIGSMLDDVVANCTFLTASASEQQSGLADGYLYCLTSGMPKYWLDISGAADNRLALHCYFRSSDPTFYERSYYLDLSSAVNTENALEIHRVYDQDGADCSDSFRSMKLRFYLDGAVMTVERDEKTMTGGTEDNILTGSYRMKPVGVDTDSTGIQRRPRPVKNGPFQADELGEWARIDYFINTGFFPTMAEVTENQDGTFAVHLFEIVESDGEKHMVSSARYTVDAYGEGKDDITKERVSLMR